MVTGRDEGQVVLAGPDGGERRFRPSGNAAGNLGLYDTERIELRAGERIRWTRNRKAPRPRFGHPAQPDLVNGGEAEIVEIDRKRVRFRDEGGREFGFALKDPQLRHLDHAYCSTVHAAQGRTARGVIAVLDACGAMDQAMFHVEVSRASEAFLLLTDDREALVEMLEAHRPDRDDGALEALGLDPAKPPVVEPELFETLVADWRALQGPSEETGALPFFLPGYEAVMARAAALSVIEDLPADMRGFVDGMLAEHERHLAHDREVQNLAERIREAVAALAGTPLVGLGPGLRAGGPAGTRRLARGGNGASGGGPVRACRRHAGLRTRGCGRGPGTRAAPGRCRAVRARLAGAPGAGRPRGCAGTACGRLRGRRRTGRSAPGSRRPRPAAAARRVGVAAGP